MTSLYKSKKLLKQVLLVSNEMTCTGAPRSLLNIANMICKLGGTVTVWTLAAGEFSIQFEQAGFRVEMIPVQIEKEGLKNFDLVILNTFFTAHLSKTFQQLTRTILYIREAQNIPNLARDCGLNVRDISAADEVICVSEYAEQFIKTCCMPKKLNVLHNFVMDEYTGQLNLVRDNKVHFIISGTYEERKGHDIVIAAFLNMPDELKKITVLHIAGQKPEWSRSFWKGLKLQYDDRIIDHGYITDPEERVNLYRQMNVFVIASRDESCSLVALEGAMLGKALIMSENVGAGYLDKDKSGIYPTVDANALCRKMSELTSRKELLLRGLKMRRMYEKTSTEKRFLKEFRKIIEMK